MLGSMARKPRVRPEAPTTALDHALDALAAGDAERALRYAIPALTDEASGAPALDLVGRALSTLGHDELAVEAHDLAVKLLSHQGLVPHAVAAALAHRALSKSDELVREVARAFGADAPRGPEVPPPPLKSEDIAPLPNSLRGRPLVDRAATALRAQPRPTSVTMPRPRLPLWGALPTEHFERFARALSVRLLAPGERAMREGEPGQSALVIARGEVRVTRAPRRDEEDEVELATLGPGAIVGEMALVTEAPRAATVTAPRAALVLEAPRAALDEAALEVPALREQVVAFCHRRLVDNVLRTSVILREVPATEREGLAQLFETRTFEPGEALITEGETGAALHLIAAGRVEVSRHEDGGDALRIASLGPGDCVGEISLVLRRPATASVVAVSPTVSLSLAPGRFMDVVKGRPMLLASLYELAVRREDETLSVLAQQAQEVDDTVLI